MRINTIMQHEFEPGKILEATTSAQNVKFNSILIDFRFIPTQKYIEDSKTKNPYRVLSNIILNANLRTGAGNGKNALLVDRVGLLLLEEYSDFIGGVDATLSEMKAGQEWRVSGSLPIGYLQVGDNDSLDFNLYCRNDPEISAKVYISTVFTEVQNVNILSYSRTKATGSSQTFDNVLGAFITTEKPFNDTISITDQLNNEVVNVESCIAYSNAVGRFEKFKRFGQFYCDEYGVGQTVTMNVPVIDEEADILLTKYVYNLSLQVKGESDNNNNRRSLFTQIASKNPDKFRFLQNLGVDTMGVVLASSD